MDDLLFQGWRGLYRTILVGVPAYAALLVTLRFSGKRTLSKLNAFDLVITVSLGSTLATILLNKDVALAEGATALGLLVAMQFAVTWTVVRWPAIERVIKSEPTMLFYRGRYLDEQMRRERITKEEILAAVRSHKLPDTQQAEAVILETDGSLSVVAPRLSSEALSLVKLKETSDSSGA